MNDKMKELLEQFVKRCEGFSSWAGKKQVNYIAYFLIKEHQQEVVKVDDILKCYELLDMKPYSRIAAYLSESVKQKDGPFVKINSGYKLTRPVFEEISQQVDHEPKRVAVSVQLTQLVAKVQDSNERAFLQEALNCYRVEAYRAAIVMVWLICIYHLEQYVLGNKLADFNNSLAKNPAGKLQVIKQIDDFAELKEVKFIELLRAADIISNDVRKILDEKLGIRNTAAHPSGIVIGGHKTTEFASDIIENVLLKY